MLNAISIGKDTQLQGNWAAKLQRFVSPQATEHCELCGKAVMPEHAHLLDVKTRQAVCACRACATVVGGREDGRFRGLPDRVQVLDDFSLTDVQWASLQIPIGMAFICVSEASGPVAYYPGPAGATESPVEPQAWESIMESNPSLSGMRPEVEALLANRIKDKREYFRLPVDRCFLLVALFRKHWRGISGSDEVWQRVDAFFASLRSGEGGLLHG